MSTEWDDEIGMKQDSVDMKADQFCEIYRWERENLVIKYLVIFEPV